MSTEKNYLTLGKGDLTLDAWGHQITTRRFSLAHAIFTFDVSKKIYRGDVNGAEIDLAVTPRIRSEGGRLVIDTLANNGDISLLSTRKHPRYQPNRSHTYSASIGIPDPTAAAVQDFGMFTEDNGVFFRCHIDGELYACIMSGGAITHEELITLPDSFEDGIDLTKGNNFDIQAQWRGVGDYFFYIENPKTEDHRLVHKIRFLNSLDNKLSIENPALPIAYRVTSLGGVGSLWSGCADITSVGGDDRRQEYGFSVHEANNVATDAPILAIHQPSLINGEVNTRDIAIVRISIDSPSRGRVGIYRTRDATAFTGGTFTTVENSFVQENIGLTAVDPAKLERFKAVRFQANQIVEELNPDPEKIEFLMVRGDYLVAVLEEGNNITVEVEFEWGEDI